MAFLSLALFSYLGIMFVIVYNASIWGLTIVSAVGGGGIIALGQVGAAVFPHLF